MLHVNLITGFPPANSTLVSQNRSNQEDQDIWFDAIDHVEMEETWFDPPEEHHADPSSYAGEAADSRVPFTEDCRRGVQQFVRTLGEYGESKMLSACLSQILPGPSTSILIAATSLYTAITERRNIDTAAVHALGLASWYLPEDINAVSRLTAFIRDTVIGWTDDTFLQQFLCEDENHTSIPLFTALAVAAIVARCWMKNEGSPQRGLLRVPAFMANIFIRASHYWTALGNMASRFPLSGEMPENTQPSRFAPAFEVDTQVEVTGEVCAAALHCSSSAPRLTAFSSNSTATPGAYIRATVKNRPASTPVKNAPLSFHELAVEQLREESGLSDLLQCTTLKTETRQQANEKVVTATHFNSKCDAIAYPEPLRKAAECNPVNAGIPATRVSSSATSQSGGDASSPLLITAAASVATSYINALKSKTFIIAGTTTGLLVLGAGGKALWNWSISPEPTNKDESNFSFMKSSGIDIQKFSLSGTPKEAFRKYRLTSDYSGKSGDLKPRAAMKMGLVRNGSNRFQTIGYLTFSLPPQRPMRGVHQVGVTKKLKKGMSNIRFYLKSDTGSSKCKIFSLRKNGADEVLSLSKKGRDLIIWDHEKEEVIKDFFVFATNPTQIDVTVNLGLMSFIDMNVNGKNLHTTMHDDLLTDFFVGIDCKAPSKYFREVSIKDLTTEHAQSHDLVTDWSSFISVMEKTGMDIDRSINPFAEGGIKFYGSEEHLKIIAERETVFESIHQGIGKRSVSADATLTTALNAVSFVYLTRVLSDPKIDRDTKEKAIVDYVKIASADIFSFSAGLVEHMDPFKLVSGSYSAGVKGVLKTAGASAGIIFSALNFIEGVKEEDLAKISSATLGALGAISGVLLSGFTGFGFTLFIMGGVIIFDAISDTKTRGEQREAFFKDAILNTTRNRLYNYAWISKTNQKGESDGDYNELILDAGNLPGGKQKSETGEYLFYETLSGFQYITPEKAGSSDNITYNTSPANKNKGFIGFKTRDTTKDKPVSHIIYASNIAVKDTSYMGHNNQGKDSIQGYSEFLNGDDTIISGSINARINAGDGDDVVFASGLEEIIDGGAGSNMVIIDGAKGKVILNVFSDGNASAGDTILKNFGSYVLIGHGHEVIVDPNGLTNTIPVFICSGGGRIILRNPISTNDEAIVEQKGNTLKHSTGKYFTYASILNRISSGEKTIALQKGFIVSTLYDDRK